MADSNHVRKKSSNTSFGSQVIGPILTVVTLVAIEVLSQTKFAIPNPGPISLTTVVYATFSGSFWAGLISAAISLVYALGFFSNPGHLFEYTDENARHLLVLAFTTPALVLMVGFLKRRAEQALRLEATNDILNQQLGERKQVEEKLRRANERFELAAAAINGIIYELDLTQNTIERTQGLSEVLGYQIEEAQTTVQWWMERIHPDDRQRVHEEINSKIAASSSFTVEYRIRHKNDRYLYVWDRGLIVRDADGRAVRVVGCTLDISESRIAQDECDRAHSQLETERALLEAVLRQLPVGAIVAEAPSGKLILGNEQVDRIWRHPFRQSRDIEEYREYQGFHADGRPYQPQEWPLARSISTGEVVIDEEIQFLRGDDTRGTMHVSSSPVCDRAGKLVAAVVTFFDITQRSSNQALLATQNTVLEMIAKGAALPSVLDVLARLIEQQSDGALCSILLMNKEKQKLYRGAAPSIPNSYFQAVPDGIPIGAVACSCGTAVYRREPVVVSDIANDFLWAEYKDLPLSHGFQACWSVPIFATNGDILGTFAMYYRKPQPPSLHDQKLVEISTNLAGIAIERHCTEEAKRQSEARFRRLVESNIIGVVFADFNGNVTDTNDAFLNLLGYTRQELQTGKVRWDIMTPEEFDDLDRHKNQEMLNSGTCTPWEKEYVRKDGSRVPVLVGLARLEESPDSCVAFVLDRTQRKRAEEALKESEKRFRQLAENIDEVFWIRSDAPKQLLYVSPAYEKIWGRTTVSLYEDPSSWVNSIHPEDRERVIAAAKKQSYEKYDQEYRIARPDGEERWIRDRAFPIQNDRGEVYRIVGIAEDITRAKQLEATLRQQAEELERASRIKDEFLAIVSHELRTPLNAMLGWATMLRTRKLNETTTARALETIERNAKSQVKLIEDLLDVSRLIRGQIRLNIRPVDLILVIESSINTVLPSCEAKAIALESMLVPDIGVVMGDAERLQQIVWNLLSNAIKFTPEGGRVTVKLSTVKGNESSGIGNSNPSNPFPIPNHAQIEISDTGLGISPDFLPYVFERFRQADSTTTRSQAGLGLGLAIVRQLVELHGGTVEVTSPGEGLGATFTVRLPLLERTQVGLKTSGLLAQRQEVQIDLEQANEKTQNYSYSSTLNPQPSALSPLPSSSLSPQSSALSPLPSSSLTPPVLNILSGVRILVVDDEADAREFLSTALEQYGGKILAVASVLDALEALEQFQPDVLVSDIGMPLEDGYSLIAKVRNHSAERVRRLPALTLTAYASSADTERASAAGFDGHIAKPVEPSLLAEAIAKLIR
ncbi:PAS domain-containing protein [Coleofasciculus sp. FACHB-SPT36]|uniref:PAS domain-containing protein n=1 Tax=Cyanophyceae TaxID=3028117 RepID=UPI00168AE48A|nr:PAS domain-containing protein [Coleofasciculus sp. FACHB-SPT36]MBD2537974.1 PAS domain-containing protein [Coleofasciculus sp. FACHB-SPT36]